MSHIMEKNLSYYIGYVLTIIVSVVITPFYAICIALIRSLSVLIEIIWDTFTFMPRALFEYNKTYQKKYWKKELDRINQKFKDD